MWLIRLTPTQALSEEGELRLRVLAKLGAFVHRSDDVCLAQDLVRDGLPRSNSGSEGDASIGNFGRVGHFTHVTHSPLGWRHMQTVHVVDELLFVHVPLICQASTYSATHAAGRWQGCAFLGRQAGSLLTPAFWLRGLLADAVPLQRSFTPVQGRVPAACRAAVLPRVSTATFPSVLGCTPGSRQRLLALHHDP